MILNPDEYSQNADWSKRTWDIHDETREQFIARLLSQGVSIEEIMEIPTVKYAQPRKEPRGTEAE